MQCCYYHICYHISIASIRNIRREGNDSNDWAHDLIESELVHFWAHDMIESELMHFWAHDMIESEIVHF